MSDSTSAWIRISRWCLASRKRARNRQLMNRTISLHISLSFAKKFAKSKVGVLKWDHTDRILTDIKRRESRQSVWYQLQLSKLELTKIWLSDVSMLCICVHLLPRSRKTKAAVHLNRIIYVARSSDELRTLKATTTKLGMLRSNCCSGGVKFIDRGSRCTPSARVLTEAKVQNATASQSVLEVVEF